MKDIDNLVKAAVFFAHGGPEVLQIADVPVPEYGDNDVLIKVKAFALNRLDLWSRDGLPTLKLEFPHVGSSDFSGIVEEVGLKVTKFNKGDRVLVNAGISCRDCEMCNKGEHSLCNKFHLLGEHVWGGAAEFAVVPETNLMKFPTNIPFEEAAAIPLTLLTVYRMLVSKAKVKTGDTVLVIGAGGGIGTAAVQVAKANGAKVIAVTSSEEKERVLKNIGADHVVNYKENPDWGKAVYVLNGKQGVDITVDSTGEKVWEQAIRSLKKGGVLVNCGATSGYKGMTNLRLLFWNQITIYGSTMANDTEFFEAMALFVQGKVKPVIDKVYDFADIQKAHQRLESEDHIGKIVIRI